jgi:hypothetical protein
VLEITKTAAVDNLFFEYSPRVDLSHWQALGELVFDINVTSIVQGTEVLVNADSGWPNAGNIRISPGSTVNLADVANPFVIFPQWCIQ